MTMLEILVHEAGASCPDHGIRELRLARPPVNALDLELIRALTGAVKDAAHDAAIVISGQPGLFSAGLDIRSLLQLDRDGIAALFLELWRVQQAVAFSPVPVIFGLTGHSPAGGTVMAIHGDYRVMAQGDFRMGLNEVQVGLFPGSVIYGAFRRLTGGHAAQLLTRGALIDPATALRVGLVDELCEMDRVAARALEFCALPRGPMLRTRALARADLLEMFGSGEDAITRECEFAAMGVEMWFASGTQELLRRMFAKR
jgi:enoyl-CoA hydratase/carnithine racemase